MFYQKNDLLEKAVRIKRCEYSPLGSEPKKETDVAKKQNHGLNKAHRFDKEDDEIINQKPTLKSILNQI